MRYGKPDGNQAAIVGALRRAGFAVRILSVVGDGFPDLIVAWAGGQILLEVKRPGETLRPNQEAFFRSWPGPKAVVHSEIEALETVLSEKRKAA